MRPSICRFFGMTKSPLPRSNTGCACCRKVDGERHFERVRSAVRLLPEGRRRTALRTRFEQFLRQAFEGRIPDFDRAAARSYGEVMGGRREMGRPMSVPDGQIAAIARSRDYAVATRNVSDFEECGVVVVNPFEG